MKIAVINNIIDTDKIYMITPVGQRSNSRGDSGYYGFEIMFYNDKALKIDQFDGPNHWATIKQLEKLRESVVKVWSNNQTEIPQYNWI